MYFILSAYYFYDMSTYLFNEEAFGKYLVNNIIRISLTVTNAMAVFVMYCWRYGVLDEIQTELQAVAAAKSSGSESIKSNLIVK